MENGYSDKERYQALQEFNKAVNQAAIEEMADDIFMYQRPSALLARLESLAAIFHDDSEIAPRDMFTEMRKEAIKIRDKECFLSISTSQCSQELVDIDYWGKQMDKLIGSHQPALRVCR